MNQKNDNFIDKTFTVLADILLKVLPATKDEKQAFSYYRYGMSAQSSGDYAEALENYYEALKLEEDPYDRSYILYNIGLIYSNNGEYAKALDYYQQALDLNSRLPQALNNMAVIYHYQGTKASEKKEFVRKTLFFQVEKDTKHSEPILLNSEFISELSDDLKMYLGFGKEATNKVYPATSIYTMPLNKKVSLIIYKWILSRVLSSLPGFIRKRVRNYYNIPTNK